MKLVNARNVSNKINSLNPASRLRKPKNESHFSAKNFKHKTRTNDGINAWKNIIEETAAEILSVASQTRAMDNIDVLSLNVQNLDDLPVLTDLDIEEVIANQQNNEEVITPKVNNFNVDSLLNDPYSL
uniref:Uncharacterized protein n=1 Tax=Schizaphis graminum TaxID=13262 RepID=A0A2S2P5X0_SCHGA